MSPEAQQALNLFKNTNEHLLIVGQAGTGKSFLLRKMAECLAPHQSAVVAPTGMAALNCDGNTIHGLFHLPVDKYPYGIITRDSQWCRNVRNQPEFAGLETLFVDEISMVRADVLDAVDHVLRIQGPKPGQPFGGVRIIAFGDPLQLPPVETADHRPWFNDTKDYTWKSPWFFAARAWATIRFTTLELEDNHRQHEDPEFASLLRSIRVGDLTYDGHRSLLASLSRQIHDQDMALRVMCTNQQVDDHNNQRLHSLPGTLTTFTAYDRPLGKWVGETPVNREIHLKIGARVMLRANLEVGEGWVNGTIGRVVEIDPEAESVVIEDDAGKKKIVARHTWKRELSRPRANRPLDEANYCQIPLTLAWAVTIHKMQGQTASGPIVLEADNAFVGGQVYVGLSRVKNRHQLSLARPLRRNPEPEQRAMNFMKQIRPQHYGW